MSSRRSGTAARHRFVFLRIPAVLALLLQATAFAIVLLLAQLLPLVVGAQLSVGAAALAQGVFAAALARVVRLASWWLAIQFLFPVAVVAAHAVHLPPALYLTTFLLFLVLYWSTFRTQVPFYPSTPAVWHAVAEMVPEEAQLRVIDIGSGFGGLAMYLARVRPECSVTGIELAPLPWVCSLVRGRLAGSAARFIRGDYGALNFGDFDVVFAYLSPAAMPDLWRKAHSEMRKGSLLLSYEFAIPDRAPELTIDPVEGGPSLYGWRIP